jgi:hypothetical protein
MVKFWVQKVKLRGQRYNSQVQKAKFRVQKGKVQGLRYSDRLLEMDTIALEL